MIIIAIRLLLQFNYWANWYRNITNLSRYRPALVGSHTSRKWIHATTLTTTMWQFHNIFYTKRINLSKFCLWNFLASLIGQKFIPNKLLHHMVYSDIFLCYCYIISIYYDICSSSCVPMQRTVCSEYILQNNSIYVPENTNISVLEKIAGAYTDGNWLLTYNYNNYTLFAP